MIPGDLAAAAKLAAARPSAAPPLPGPAPEEERLHREGRQHLFIAPSGGLFRAPPDEPYPVAEFTADFLRFCASLDVNHDGVVDAEEIDRYETTIAPEVHAADVGGGGEKRERGRPDWPSKPPDQSSARGTPTVSCSPAPCGPASSLP